MVYIVIAGLKRVKHNAVKTYGRVSDFACITSKLDVNEGITLRPLYISP
jgi:hypothetical protein